MVKLLFVVGARPNFMKVAPVLHALKNKAGVTGKPISVVLVHTGQHHDAVMSDVFFTQLGMPSPDYNLGVSGGERDEQIDRIITAFEPVVRAEHAKVKIDCIVVAGDVNSTTAAARVAHSLGVPLAHIESGLRSFDLSMPEEHNRVQTDRFSEYLFLTSPEAVDNLAAEGIRNGKIDAHGWLPAPRRVFVVGNSMIDSLKKFEPTARQGAKTKALGVDGKKYGLVTLHRAGNVDTRDGLERVISIVLDVASRVNVVFPMHPRTAKRLSELAPDLEAKLKANANVKWIEPLDYVGFLDVMMHAAFVLTDSGGVQEETSVLGVPCLTLRPNTERPITVTRGTGTLVKDPAHVRRTVGDILSGRYKKHQPIPLWDGKAGERIAHVLAGIA